MRKTVFITGATSGIGEACARKFAQGGYNLIITARRAEKLAEIKTQLEAEGAKVKTLTFDVRDAQAAQAAVESLDEEWQKIDVLINNAGLALGLDKEYEGDPEDWNTMIDTNIKGLLYVSRALVPNGIYCAKSSSFIQTTILHDTPVLWQGLGHPNRHRLI